MKWNQATAMEREVSATLEDALKLAYLSCGIELQMESINRLADLYDSTNDFLEAAISRQDEELANRTFILRQFICGTQSILRMWVHLKQDEVGEGWNALIDAQCELECGLRFDEHATFREVAKRLLVLEDVLFPPQIFTSPSLEYQSASCTICGGEYGECGHLAGRLYMGSMCGIRPKDFVGFNHQAIVQVPKDKGCRITKVQEGMNMVDKLTHRVVGEVENPVEGHLKMESICLRANDSQSIYRIDLEDSSEQIPIV